MEDVSGYFQDQPAVLDYLNRVLEDVVEYTEELFLSKEASGGIQGVERVDEAPAFNLTRYRVNLLVDHRSSKGCYVCMRTILATIIFWGESSTFPIWGPLTDFTRSNRGCCTKPTGVIW